MVLTGRQKASVLVRLRGWKTYGKDILASPGKQCLIGTLYEPLILHFRRNECLVRPNPKKRAEKRSVPD
jgi:hypothetical protein